MDSEFFLSRKIKRRAYSINDNVIKHRTHEHLIFTKNTPRRRTGPLSAHLPCIYSTYASYGKIFLYRSLVQGTRWFFLPIESHLDYLHLCLNIRHDDKQKYFESGKCATDTHLVVSQTSIMATTTSFRA